MNETEWKHTCLERDDYKCQILGGSACTVHHIIKRRFRTFIWNPDNGISVGTEAHDLLEKDKDKDTMRLVVASIGRERFERLRKAFIDLEGYDYFKDKGV